MKSATNRMIKPGISKTSKGRYRCRVMRNGKLLTTYKSNLTTAQVWVKAAKNGVKPSKLALL